VVCSRLPSFEPIAGLVTLAGPAEFAAAALDAARHGSVGSEERVANARANSWEARTAQLNAHLDEITTPDD